MGGASCKMRDQGDNSTMKFVVLGLPRSGKTTFLHRLKHGVILDNPYHSFDVEIEELERDGVQLLAWDYGGRGYERLFVKLACMSASGIIYMIDSSDPERLEETLDFLNYLLYDEVSSNMTVMVVANKQDLDDAVGLKVIEKKVKEFCKIRKDITLFVMPMTATADDDHSLQLAYSLFFKTMKRKRNGKYKTGFIPRAWETAEKMSEDSDIEDGGDENEAKNKDDFIRAKEDKKKKSFFKKPIHMFKSLLMH